MALIGLWRAARPLDRAIIGLLLMFAVAGLWWSMTGTAGRELVVEQGGELVYVAPLNEETRFAVPGELGPTGIEVAAGSARVATASCPQRLCMAMGRIDEQGELVACVPNKLVLYVRGEARESGYDLLTQ